jgi:hypothetical protein
MVILTVIGMSTVSGPTVQMFPVSVNVGCSNEIRSGNILDEEVEVVVTSPCGLWGRHSTDTHTDGSHPQRTPWAAADPMRHWRLGRARELISLETALILLLIGGGDQRALFSTADIPAEISYLVHRIWIRKFTSFTIYMLNIQICN